MRKNKLITFPLILVIVSLACGTGGSDASTERTIEAISASVRATGTASAAQGSQAQQVDTS